ncbi:MAG TPA: hypothetical protein VGK52_13765, partial [Polyangia bacterium]
MSRFNRCRPDEELISPAAGKRRLAWSRTAADLNAVADAAYDHLRLKARLDEVPAADEGRSTPRALRLPLRAFERLAVR